VCIAASSGERVLRNPTTGMAGRCAWAAKDPMAVIPIPAMNSRRFIQTPGNHHHFGDLITVSDVLPEV